MNKVAKYKATAGAGLADKNQDELVRKQAPLVKRIAYHLMSRLPPTVQVDDLVQSGMIGLLEASRNYDASQGRVSRLTPGFVSVARCSTKFAKVTGRPDRCIERCAKSAA